MGAPCPIRRWDVWWQINESLSQLTPWLSILFRIWTVFNIYILFDLKIGIDACGFNFYSIFKTSFCSLAIWIRFSILRWPDEWCFAARLLALGREVAAGVVLCFCPAGICKLPCSPSIFCSTVKDVPSIEWSVRRVPKKQKKGWIKWRHDNCTTSIFSLLQSWLSNQHKWQQPLMCSN